MKLSYLQLPQQLSKKVAALYLIASDELLLVQEAIAAICDTANKTGFTEHVTIVPTPSSDWGKLIYSDAHNFSLFSSKKIIELHLHLTKFTAAHSKILEDLVENPSENTVLIIHTAKLETKIEKSPWYQFIEKHGVIVQIWPLQAEQLPQWIMQRAKKNQINLTKQAAEKLANYVEGNLLAAAQEIEKITLLQLTETIDHTMIDEIITDHAHFDIFNLVDSALIGNSARCLRILRSLVAEKIAPTLVLWALTRELRTLAEIQQAKSPLPDLFKQFRIWEKRQPLVRAFLKRHTLQQCWDLLLQAARIDRIIKGVEIGHSWDELEKLAMRVASLEQTPFPLSG